MSEAQIDYSRPVGWWCPVCGNTNHVSSIGPDGRERQRFCIQSARTGFCFRRAIPRYLPIPEGQRPPAASEVDEAEIATGSLRDDSPCCWVTIDAVYAPDNGWLAAIVHLAEYADADHINDIANESTHIVTGATE